MKKGFKARPHDLTQVMKLGPEMIEIHASSEDLNKNLDGTYDIPLAVHFPEYDGSVLIDPASTDDAARHRASELYKLALDTTRRWGKQFRGTPKAIVHPGGWSIEPLKYWEKNALYDAFHTTVKELNTNGVEFCVENLPPHPWYFGGQWHSNIFMDAKDCRDFCTGNGYGFCLDLCHAFLFCRYLNGRDPNDMLMDYVRTVRPILSHVHVSDGKGTDGEGIQIGDGEMNLEPVLHYLSKTSVGMVPEVWLSHKDDFKEMKVAWQRMEKWLS